MKLKYFMYLYIIIFMKFADTTLADERDFCSVAKKEEAQCGSYAFKIVNPLLGYIRKIQDKLKDNDNKERIVSELQIKVNELRKNVSDNVQKDKTIELCQKFYDSSMQMNEAHIQDLRGQIEFLTTTLEQQTKKSNLTTNESDEVAKLNRTIEAYSKTIEVQNNQILNLKAQLQNQTDLIREKDDQISRLQIEAENIAINYTTIQTELEENKKMIALEGKVNSCFPFANSPGVHKIKVPGLNPFDVLCGNAVTGPGWIVIQQRINGKEDFNRDWATYREGFGSFDGSFFLGLERIYRLTASQRHELYIYMESFDGNIDYLTYDNFAIAGENDQYQLINVDGCSDVNELDFMNKHKGQKFTTFDRDNENQTARRLRGGWWHNISGNSNLNGILSTVGVEDKTAHLWYGWGNLKKVRMLIRPKLV